ncbi:MAG TPA: exosporium glycoprotein BclB-related protein [Flavipsychrobacter sp.]|nr:exosporium glycoprotein BclB-related protein [Flavipsychrobacter sp.]
MKKLSIIMFAGLLSGGIASAQNNVGINTATPPASAALAVDTSASGPQGVLIPRMTQARRNAISSPATSLMIYQTDNTPGFYYYNGSSWVPFVSSSSGGGAIIPYASGTPVTLTTIALGLVGTTATVGFGGSASGISIAGGLLDLSTVLNNHAFTVPRAGTITSVYADFRATLGLNLIGSTVNVSAQLYSAPAGSNIFSPVSGTAVSLTPALTGIVSLGSLSEGSLTGLSIPVTAGTKLLLVYSATATGLSLINTVVGVTGGGVSVQ